MPLALYIAMRNIMTAALGVAVILMWSGPAFGQDGKDAPKKPGFGKRAEGDRPEGPRPEGKDVVKKIIERFDKDGDGALNARELAAFLKSMRERRAEGDQPGPGGRPGFRRPKPGAEGGPRPEGPRDRGPREGGPRDGGPAPK